MFNLDRYVIFARIMPAVIASVPALSLAGALIVFNWLSFAQIITSLAIVALLYLCGDIARRRGKALEASLYDELGGKPSVAMLRFRDTNFDNVKKARYRSFLAQQIGEEPPSNLDEENDPVNADRFYERCETWLRENTRDPVRFRLLLAENINYGFRRNLFALRKIAIVTNVIVIAICALYFYHDYIGLGLKSAGTIKMIMGFAVIHSAFLLLYPSRQSVIEASRTYARQLLQCCEILMPAGISKAENTTSPKRKKKGA